LRPLVGGRVTSTSKVLYSLTEDTAGYRIPYTPENAENVPCALSLNVFCREYVGVTSDPSYAQL